MYWKLGKMNYIQLNSLRPSSFLLANPILNSPDTFNILQVYAAKRQNLWILTFLHKSPSFMLPLLKTFKTFLLWGFRDEMSLFTSNSVRLAKYKVLYVIRDSTGTCSALSLINGAEIEISTRMDDVLCTDFEELINHDLRGVWQIFLTSFGTCTNNLICDSF